MEPAVAADADINKILQDSLQKIIRPTQEFMKVRVRGYSLASRHETLKAFAGSMSHVADMIHALEGEKHLSPLFDRIVNREYTELNALIWKMHDVVFKDVEELKTIKAEKAQAPDPLAFAFTMMLMPVAITCGIVSGVLQALNETPQQRNARMAPQPHLKLVQG